MSRFLVIILIVFWCSNCNSMQLRNQNTVRILSEIERDLPGINESAQQFWYGLNRLQNYLYALKQNAGIEVSPTNEVSHRVKRCANLWDENCINGGLTGSGIDDNYLRNGNNPGK